MRSLRAVVNTRDLEYLTFGDFDARPGRISLGSPPPLTFATIGFEDAKVWAVNSQDSKSTAFFGQTDIHFTDRLSATVGGRITMDDKKFSAQTTFPVTRRRSLRKATGMSSHRTGTRIHVPSE